MNGNKRDLGSDLAKVDAHVIQAEEYEEIPELDDDWFDRADRKVSTTLRLDPDVVQHFKAAGPGWQTRINEALRKAAGL